MTGSVRVVLATDWSDTRSSSPGLGGFTMYSSTCTESSKMKMNVMWIVKCTWSNKTNFNGIFCVYGIHWDLG